MANSRPTILVICPNMVDLAHYTRTYQSEGLTLIVEPDVFFVNQKSQTQGKLSSQRLSTGRVASRYG